MDVAPHSLANPISPLGAGRARPLGALKSTEAADSSGGTNGAGSAKARVAWVLGRGGARSDERAPEERQKCGLVGVFSSSVSSQANEGALVAGTGSSCPGTRTGSIPPWLVSAARNNSHATLTTSPIWGVLKQILPVFAGGRTRLTRHVGDPTRHPQEHDSHPATAPRLTRTRDAPRRQHRRIFTKFLLEYPQSAASADCMAPEGCPRERSLLLQQTAWHPKGARAPLSSGRAGGRWTREIRLRQRPIRGPSP